MDSVWSETRCNPPVCVRVIGHSGACRPTWHSREICGEWMPQSKERCARRPGHAWEHRTAWALSCDRDRTAETRVR